MRINNFQLGSSLPFEDVEERVNDIVKRFPLNRALRIQAGLMQLNKLAEGGLKPADLKEGDIERALSEKVQVPI